MEKRKKLIQSKRKRHSKYFFLFSRLYIYFPSLSEEPGSEYTPFQQAMAQLAALGITLAFAIVGGSVTGKNRPNFS
jgi:hypothetical protein